MEESKTDSSAATADDLFDPRSFRNTLSMGPDSGSWRTFLNFLMSRVRSGRTRFSLRITRSAHLLPRESPFSSPLPVAFSMRFVIAVLMMFGGFELNQCVDGMRLSEEGILTYVDRTGEARASKNNRKKTRVSQNEKACDSRPRSKE